MHVRFAAAAVIVECIVSHVVIMGHTRAHSNYVQVQSEHFDMLHVELTITKLCRTSVCVVVIVLSRYAIMR